MVLLRATWVSPPMSEVDDNKAELLDDDVTGAEYSPDNPVAVGERLTAIEEQSSLAENEVQPAEEAAMHIIEPPPTDV